MTLCEGERERGKGGVLWELFSTNQVPDEQCATRLTPTLWGKINNEAWLMIHLMFLYGYIMIKLKIKVLFWHYNLKKRKERKSVPYFNSFIRNNTYSQFSILLLVLLSTRKSYTAISGIPSNKVCYETYIISNWIYIISNWIIQWIIKF